VPNEIVISQLKGDKDAEIQGYVLLNWPNIEQTRDFITVGMTASHWTFDGTFERVKTGLNLHQIPSEDVIFPITELAIYPKRFARPNVVQVLENRGRMFWKCRQHNYVCLKNTEDDGLRSTVCISSTLFTLESVIDWRTRPTLDSWST
jgi:hypothetical protein